MCPPPLSSLSPIVVAVHVCSYLGDLGGSLTKYRYMYIAICDTNEADNLLHTHKCGGSTTASNPYPRPPSTHTQNDTPPQKKGGREEVQPLCYPVRAAFFSQLCVKPQKHAKYAKTHSRTSRVAGFGWVFLVRLFFGWVCWVCFFLGTTTIPRDVNAVHFLPFVVSLRVHKNPDRASVDD